MKRFHLFLCLLSALLTIALAGCVRLPSVKDAFANVPASPTGTSATTLKNGPVVLPDGKVTSAEIAPAKASPTRAAIQHAVDWVTVICVLGSLAAIAFGAFLIYSGQLLAGIKCVVGGVLLMIASIWFAYHWLLIVSLCLIGAGVYLAITYWSYISPILSKLESDISPAISGLASRVESLVGSKAATTTPAASATPAAPAAPAPAPAAAPATVAK